MTPTSPANPDSQSFTIHIPLRIHRRGGRKVVVSHDGNQHVVQPVHRVDNAMAKAIVRGYRWMRMLESGEYATIEDLAGAEKINPSFVSRMLRLTLLAPEILETILAGRQSGIISLATLMKPFPVEWVRQNSKFQLKRLNHGYGHEPT